MRQSKLRGPFAAPMAVLILSAVFALVASVGDVAGDECRATVTASMSQKQSMRSSEQYAFEVEARTSAACALVNFELNIRERPKRGDERVKTIASYIKVREGVDRSRRVTHRTDKDVSVVGWEVRMTGCRTCSTAD
jgi:hypothetical protein